MRHALGNLRRDALTLVAHNDNARLVELGRVDILALEEGAIDLRKVPGIVPSRSEAIIRYLPKWK